MIYSLWVGRRRRLHSGIDRRVQAMIFDPRWSLPLVLVIWGKYSWCFAALYAAACWVLLHLLFDQAVHVQWYPSTLFG